MAYTKVVFALFSLACLLLSARADACDEQGLRRCMERYSPVLTSESDRDKLCSNLGRYFDCLDSNGMRSCAEGSGLASRYNSEKRRFAQVCGAAQFLMSWPLYLIVLVLTLRQIFVTSV